MSLEKLGSGPRWSHDRWRYNGELFDILVTEIIEAVHRASRDTQGLPGTNLDWRAINRPGQDTLDAIKNLLVGVILVRRGGQLLPHWHADLEHGCAAVRVFASTRNRIPSGPILIVSSEGLTLFVGCCINRLLCTKLSYTSYLSSERIQVRIEFADRQRERLRSQLSVGDKSR